MHDGLTRRHLLGVTGAVAVAGCLSEDESEESESSDDEPTDGNGSSDGNGSADGNESADEEPTVHEEYETTEVRAVTPDGDELGTVTAAIADTRDLRYLGLSDTEELPEDRGMLFVYDSVDDRTFVMREMDFGIDIVYADADGTITDIHHASAPEPGEDGEEEHHQYPGRGQYVLEVVYEWTTDHDVGEGDVLEFDLEE